MEIYKITNKINGKIYIGLTIRPIKVRFARHITDALSGVLDTHFARAIRKYGAENFYIESIDTAETQEELTKKEYYWIKFYDSTKIGYNETDATCKCGGNTYLSKSEEDMNKIKEKLRISKLGSKNPKAEQVRAINIQTNEEFIFGSMCECARVLNFPNHVCISRRCLGLISTPYRNIWKFELINNEPVSTIPDECKGVDVEISTTSKQLATDLVEDIVSTSGDRG